MKKLDTRRPPAQISRSFSRPEMSSDSPTTPSRSRASTITAPIVPVPEARQLILSPEDASKRKKGDIFENTDESNDALDAELDSAISEPSKPESLDQLPIEIQSISERYDKCVVQRYMTDWLM